MTDFDHTLIKKAEKFRPWEYIDIDILMKIADTDEARDELLGIRMLLWELMQETL